MVYILQNLRRRQKTSDIDTLLVIQYKYYKIREVGGKIMYQKGQYIIYGIRGVCEVMDIITIDRLMVQRTGCIMYSVPIISKTVKL